MEFLNAALRHIRKHKLITAINVLSLAIGISATLVIFLLIQYDYSFDKKVENSDRIYRIVSDGEFKNPGVLVPLVRALEDESTGIQTIVPLYRSHKSKLKIYKDSTADYQVFPKESGVVFTNSNYFSLYPHQWLVGNAESLNTPNNIVLTQKDFSRYFPQKHPTEAIGKTLIFADSVILTLTGVVQEMAQNSDFKFNSFISTATIPVYPSLKQIFSWDAWNNYTDAYQCLALVTAGTTPSKIESEIKQILEQHKPKEENGWQAGTFTLQPLSDIHFNSDFNYNAVKSDTTRNLILLALFLLALGIINFVNLSTAQSIERAKEVGIRKTLGSSKQRLALQFLTETSVIALTATVFALLLLPLLLHAFEGFIPQGLKWTDMPKLDIGIFLVVQLLIVTFLAGFYPAWILTGYSPALALKNQVSKNTNLSRSVWVRKSLTVFQFVLAQLFLICVLIVVKQINFATNKDMGFKKEAIVNFYIPGSFRNSAQGQLLKTKLSNIPEIKAVSFGNQSPAFLGTMTSTLGYDGVNGSENITMDARNGDENYIDVYNLKLIAGRNIRLLDSTSEMLINEKALALLRVQSPEEAIGKTFNNGDKKIVGVLQDFNIASVRTEIAPMMYWGTKDGYVMHVALDPMHPENWKIALDKMKAAFKSIFPDDEFDHTFLDQTVEDFYKEEQQLSQLLRWSVILSVIIAGLGLFGLAIFTANQRTKEIGIRKVLGASVGQIVFLLLKNLLGLVLVACLIAFPIAWYLMNKWLDNFAYKTDISWWIFVISAFGLITVAMAVLLSKTLLAAKANPVDSLRNE